MNWLEEKKKKFVAGQSISWSDVEEAWREGIAQGMEHSQNAFLAILKRRGCCFPWLHGAYVVVDNTKTCKDVYTLDREWCWICRELKFFGETPDPCKRIG